MAPLFPLLIGHELWQNKLNRLLAYGRPNTISIIPFVLFQPKKSAKSVRGKSANKSVSRSRSPKRKKSGKKSAKSRGASAKSTTRDVDVLSPAAMENLYFIAHGPVDALEMRGYGWDAGGGKKKGKKGKKKKKK